MNNSTYDYLKKVGLVNYGGTVNGYALIDEIARKRDAQTETTTETTTKTTTVESKVAEPTTEQSGEIESTLPNISAQSPAAAEQEMVDGRGVNGYNNIRGENDVVESNEHSGVSKNSLSAPKAENSGGRSTGKSVRRESKESFLRRSQGNAPSMGGRTRKIVNKGKSVYSFVPVAPDNSNGGRAAKFLLKKQKNT